MQLEITLYKELKHPNIVAFCGSVSDDKRLFIFMELMERNLREHIALRGYDEAGAISVFREMCKAVAYLHSNLIFHRDVRIENFMVDRNGAIKLGDFESVANFGDKNSQMTPLRQKKCMAPETIARKPQTHKVDIWGLGVVLYELLHKKLPFDTKSNYSVSTDENTRRFYLKEHLSPEVKEVIKLCLAENPEDRPTIEQLMEHPIFFKDPKSRVFKETLTSKGLDGKRDNFQPSQFASTLKSKTTTITEGLLIPEDNGQQKVDNFQSNSKPPFVKSAKKQIDIFDKTPPMPGTTFFRDPKTNTLRLGTSPSPVSKVNEQQGQSKPTQVDLIVSYKQIMDIVSKGSKTKETDNEDNRADKRNSQSPKRTSKREYKVLQKTSLKGTDQIIPIPEEKQSDADNKASKVGFKKDSTAKNLSRNQSLGREESPITSRKQSRAKVESIKTDSVSKPSKNSLPRNTSQEIKQEEKIEEPKPKSDHLLTNIAISKAVPSDKLIVSSYSKKRPSNHTRDDPNGQKTDRSKSKTSTLQTKSTLKNSEVAKKLATLPLPKSSKESSSRPASQEKAQKVVSVNKQVSAVLKSRNGSPVKISSNVSPSKTLGTRVVRMNKKLDPQSRSPSPGKIEQKSSGLKIKSNR